MATQSRETSQSIVTNTVGQVANVVNLRPIGNRPGRYQLIGEAIANRPQDAILPHGLALQ